MQMLWCGLGGVSMTTVTIAAQWPGRHLNTHNGGKLHLRLITHTPRTGGPPSHNLHTCWAKATTHTHTAVSRCAACILNYSNLQIVLMENWQHYLEAICFLKILSIFICHCRILTRIHRVWWGMAARTQTFTNTMQSSFHLRNFFSAFTLLWHPHI